MSTDRNGEKSELVTNAENALEKKKAMPEPAENRPDTRTPNEGMNSLPNQDQPPSGALEQEGHRPVLERTRKVR